MGMANDLDAKVEHEKNVIKRETKEADKREHRGETYRPHIMQTTLQLDRGFYRLFTARYDLTFGHNMQYILTDVSRRVYSDICINSYKLIAQINYLFSYFVD